MRALVTGGAGFVGSHLVDVLRKSGNEVTIYDKVTGGDLLDGRTLSAALTDQDVVYHFAANANPHGAAQQPTLDLEQNLLATSQLLRLMHWAKVPRIVFASSSSVYGDSQVFPTPEDAPIPNQTSLYGASKMAAEALISAYVRTFDMQATIFRFAPMLGEGYRRGHVIDFYRKIKANPEQIEILGDGTQRRSYIYVKDAVSAVLTDLICYRDVETFNVAGAATVSVTQSLNWITDAMGIWPERVYTEQSWQGDKALTWLDTSRLRALGWSPSISIKDAIVRTVRSFDT